MHGQQNIKKWYVIVSVLFLRALQTTHIYVLDPERSSPCEGFWYALCRKVLCTSTWME